MIAALMAAIVFFQYHVITTALAQVFLIAAKVHPEKKQTYFERSLAFQERDASAWEGLGDHDWLSPGMESSNAYRNAIGLHPSKAQYWLKLSYIKARLNQFDPEFYRAYQTAFDYGGWEYYVDRALMEMGLAYWYSMSVEYRLILKKTVVRLYGIDATSTLDLAKEYGQLHMTCIWVMDEPGQSRRCQRELADPKKTNHKRK